MIEHIYCGPAPSPADLWSRWNFDPFLLAGFALAIGLFLMSRRHATGQQTLWFSSAIATFAIIFISPLCALTVALFSARVVHHILLVALAAPFLALAMPATRKLPIVPLFLIHMMIFWIWHAPAIYEMAFSSSPLYWAMQASLLGSATLMWQQIFNPQTGRGAVISVLLGSIIQMGMLGALLTFASMPLYAPHFTSTAAFGLAALDDQQLAGILMWVPASVPYLIVGLWQVYSWLGRSSEHTASRAQ